MIKFEEVSELNRELLKMVDFTFPTQRPQMENKEIL
jgi:hypothetical protein